jgi:hypothetical protein
LDKRLVSSRHYWHKAKQWTGDYLRDRPKGKPAGNYYATEAKRLGGKYLDLAFRTYYQQRCTIGQLADYLNVKVSSVPGLEHVALGRSAG